MAVVAKGARAVDYAAPANTNKATLAGYALVARYLDPTAGLPGASWKCLTAGERDKLIGLGKAILLIWETTATRGLEGAAAGTTDGVAASAAAARLGYPTSATIIATFDTDINKARLPQAVAYWKAFKAACAHPVGVYGDWDIIEAVGSLSACNWQANAAGWSWDWLKNKWRGSHPLAHVQQQTQTAGVDPGVVLRPVEAWQAAVKPPQPVHIEVPAPTLKQGMHSPTVVSLQQHLNFWGWYGAGIDGIYGPQTAAGVLSMQHSLKVKADGIYGPVTAAAYKTFLAAMHAFSKA